MSDSLAEDAENYRTPSDQGRMEVQSIGLDLIQPGRMQMRRNFDPEAIADLAESILQSGLIQPVVVRPFGQGYELLAGERRWRAAQQAQLRDIPAVIRTDIDDDEALVLGLVENLQRESLSPLETAQGLQVLSQQLSLTHGEAAEKIGKSRVYVTNFLRLLNLCADVRELVNAGELSMGHARALAVLPAEQQDRVAHKCIAANWSVRSLEAYLRRPPARAAAPQSRDDWARLASALEDHLGQPVRLRGNSKGKGELRINFHNYDELEGLLERLGFEQVL